MKKTHVVIRGMERVPRTCAECPMAVSDNGYEYFCNRLKTDILVDIEDPSEQRHDDCPLYEEEVTDGLQERDAKITKKLWESMLLVNNNFDTKDPIVMAVIDKIADTVRELEAFTKMKGDS